MVAEIAIKNLKKWKTLVRFLSRPVSQTNDCGRKYVGAHIQLTKFSAQKLEKEALEGVIKEEEKEKETKNGSFWWWLFSSILIEINHIFQNCILVPDHRWHIGGNRSMVVFWNKWWIVLSKGRHFLLDVVFLQDAFNVIVFVLCMTNQHPSTVKCTTHSDRGY